MVLNIQIPSIITCVASPGGGKTQFIKQLIRNLLKNKELHYGLIFCNDEDDYINNFEEKIIFDYTNFDEEIEKIINYKENYKKSKMFIVLDDFIGKININNKLLQYLFSYYRHLNITLFLCFQHINKISRLHRNCSKYLILGKMNSNDCINCCYDLTSGFYYNKKDIKNDIYKLKEYEFLIFDLKKNKKYKYKFDKLVNFMFLFESYT